MTKYYKVNTKNQTITIDTTVIPSVNDEKMVEFYIKAGFTPRAKSLKKTKQGKQNANHITKEEILSKLSEEDRKTFDKKLDEDGFFAARSWFMEKTKEAEPKAEENS